MRALFYIGLAVLIVACAPYPSATASNGTGYSVSKNAELSNSHKRELEGLRLRLSTEKQEHEIARLKTRIEELENRIEEMSEEARKAEEYRRAQQNRYEAGAIKRGPRGGCYRISRTGKKYYVKCN